MWSAEHGRTGQRDLRGRGWHSMRTHADNAKGKHTTSNPKPCPMKQCQFGANFLSMVSLTVFAWMCVCRHVDSLIHTRKRSIGNTHARTFAPGPPQVAASALEASVKDSPRDRTCQRISPRTRQSPLLLPCASPPSCLCAVVNAVQRRCQELSASAAHADRFWHTTPCSVNRQKVRAPPSHVKHAHVDETRHSRGQGGSSSPFGLPRGSPSLSKRRRTPVLGFKLYTMVEPTRRDREDG